MDFDPHDLEWQRRYEENDTPWDKGAPSPVLTDYLRESPIAGHILVPGCGRGHDARALAAQSGADVTGLDLSPAAVTEAQRLAHSAPGQLRFVAGDFFNPPAEWTGTFDWIVEHTCFCAIDPRQRANYARSAPSLLRAGGRLFGIFYLNPGRDPGPPFPVSREELSALFDPHFALLEEWVPPTAFPGREGRELVRILQKRSPA
jgi:methyl halide transferase